ncbi:hypothetical protein EDB85DRAFT_1901777 [Lactarius pseudohatsudake]|nr:hypothetical protein EDB85DRAFT_1901777 [Lactarius pseudohatsudake]
MVTTRSQASMVASASHAGGSRVRKSRQWRQRCVDFGSSARRRHHACVPEKALLISDHDRRRPLHEEQHKTSAAASVPLTRGYSRHVQSPEMAYGTRDCVYSNRGDVRDVRGSAAPRSQGILRKVLQVLHQHSALRNQERLYSQRRQVSASPSQSAAIARTSAAQQSDSVDKDYPQGITAVEVAVGAVSKRRRWGGVGSRRGERMGSHGAGVEVGRVEMALVEAGSG